MKFSEQWLREWVDPKVSTEKLCQQLTMAGLEIDGVSPVAPAFNNVVVGYAVKVEQHPDADRLRVCQLDVGQGELLQIVCGGANMRQGLKVPVAMVGAVLPGDFKIQKAKLRGVPSMGMICSEVEIGIAESSEGIMELPEDAPIGMDIRQYLHLDDKIIEVGLTANRGDCLSMLGMAREVSVINACELRQPDIKPVAASITTQKTLSVTQPAACMRYSGRVIQNLNPQAKTPAWMVTKLARSGIRSISPVVDVTNYVMLSLGQPMHAFDLAKLQGNISVRLARAGESLALLNGQTLKLAVDDLVIADDAKVLALAGIMGGIESSVTDSTTSVFLESAHFTPNAIAGKARRVGLHTDSSHRFERGVDPALTAQALEYATQLILTIAGGEVGPVCAWQVAVHAASPISFNLNKLSAMLGLSIPKTSAVDILNRLGFAVSEQGENLSVTAPSWRFDISIPEDLIEEVARIYGYDHIPTQLPQAKLQVQAVLESHVSLNKIKQTLVTRGFREAITYSFIDPKWHEQVFPGQPAYALSNPIASDMAVMRTSLLPGLLQALRYNVQRQQTRLRLFETGRCFLLNNNAVQEQEKVAILVYGHVNPEHWSGQRTADFFDVKGDVMALLGLTAQAQDFSFTPEHKISFLHPGQSAAIQLQGQTVGCVGALHPSLIQALDLREQVLLAELDLAILQQAKLPHYHSLSKYPSIRRDLALLVNETIPAEVVCAEIKKTAGNLLQSIQVFDVYQGDKIVPGKKSLALGLVLQDVEKTLTDNEIVAVIDRILSGLQQQLNIQLRE